MERTRTSRPDRAKRLLALVLVALVLVPSLDGHDRGTHAAAESRHRLLLRARARGLYPGAVRPLRILVSNPTDHDVRVVRLVARASRSSSEACPVSFLRVRRLRSHPVVPAHSRRRVRVRVKLLASAPDACQGVRFSLRLRVRGVAA